MRRLASSARRRSSIVLAVTVALGFGIGVVAIASTRESNGATYVGSQISAGLTMPDFVLRDAVSGRRVSSSSLRGRAVALTFLDTECVDACPLIVPQMLGALADLDPSERKRTALIAVTVDPTVDTARAVETFLRRHRARGRLRYLVGNEPNLRRVWRSFYVISALESGNANTHSAPVRIYDVDGRWVSSLHLEADLTPANLAHDLRLAGAAREY